MTCQIVWHTRPPLRPLLGPPTPAPPPATHQAPSAPAPPRVHPPPQRTTYPQATQAGLVIHGGTSELVAVTQANRAARSHNRKKKGPSPSARVAKVAEGVREASPPRPPPLSNAARGFFAPRRMPAAHPDSQAIRAHFLDIAAFLLRETNCTLPIALKAVVNERGSVRLSISDNSVPAASFAPYFDPLTSRLNQSYPVGDNPWLPFRLAPTSVQLAIHSLPVPFTPDNDEDLLPRLSESILNSKDVSILSTRLLNQDRAARLQKRAFSVVVNVEPDAVQTMLPAIHLYGSPRTVERAYSSSPRTQREKCWKFIHVKHRCKEEAPTCPFCSLNHTKAQHRCPNPSCPKGANLKPVLDCCPAAPAKCPNCGKPHSARSRDCSQPPRPPQPPQQTPIAPPLQSDAYTMDTAPDTVVPLGAPALASPFSVRPGAPQGLPLLWARTSNPVTPRAAPPSAAPAPLSRTGSRRSQIGKHTSELQSP